MKSFESRFKNLLSFVLPLTVGICVMAYGSSKVVSQTVSKNSPLLLPPTQLKFFTLGYNDLVADSLWLRTIQDFDFCENRPPGQNDPNKFRCENGWVFHMIDTITEIAPDFRQPYYSGALLLSIIVNDQPGASTIFDKGVARFPSDWSMLYSASYQAMNEEKNYAKASKLLAEAGKLGAPLWVLSLSARLREKTGELELARSIMQRAIDSGPDAQQAEYFKKRLAEIDKKLADAKAKGSIH